MIRTGFETRVKADNERVVCTVLESVRVNCTETCLPADHAQPSIILPPRSYVNRRNGPIVKCLYPNLWLFSVIYVQFPSVHRVITQHVLFFISYLFCIFDDKCFSMIVLVIRK